MKKLSILIVLIWSFIPLLWANEGCQQRLTQEEFRARQQSFITERAGLTAEEAARFFPLYFEFQDQKEKLNREVWKLMRSGKEENISEDQYGKIMEEMYDIRIKSSKVEKEYFKKFQEILSNKKIYEVQHAEMRFNRELLKGMRNNKPKN